MKVATQSMHKNLCMHEICIYRYVPYVQCLCMHVCAMCLYVCVCGLYSLQCMMCVCVCVCVCMCVYVCVSLCVCLCVCMCVCACMQADVLCKIYSIDIHRELEKTKM